MNKPSIRRNQIITTFGPGALVNLIQGKFNGSYIGMGIDCWPRPNFEDKIYDDRLQKRLGKKFFVQPPSKEKNEVGLPYRRFPRWFFCPKCRGLQPYEKWEERKPRDYSHSPLVCPDDNAPLSPMNFLVACLKGHLDDFPWTEWVHKMGDVCSVDAPLKYEKKYTGAGLGGITIRCTSCGATRSMSGAFSPEAFRDRRCLGSKPWATERQGEPCGEKLTAVQKGGSNVYFPKIVSSIAIPSPYNNMVEQIKETELWHALSSMFSVGPDLITPDAISKISKQIADQTGTNEEEVHRFIERDRGVSDEQHTEISEENYLYDEYVAFNGNYEVSSVPRRDFKVEDATVVDKYVPFGIDRVIMVQSLREVRALVGFTRLRPLESEEEMDEEETDRSTLVPLSETRNNWLPAVEVRGEGIFLTFDRKKLEIWAKKTEVQERIALINTHFKDSCQRRNALSLFTPVTAKRVLLHTFAHLLIRQLSFECGYASASLRERIYCDTEGEGKMQGILVYTAAGDSDGTLGGLVRQAHADRLPQTIQAALRNSLWCSNDPLCSESKGQGFESLNLAACYACGILPETSCETFNKFLDRALVVGLPDNRSIGFFGEATEQLF